ncbi:MAG TPA: zf-TFIIB domain-containing protein [Desulfomonilia bacterium]|nr:zf-TFIIB domain-containing protein [Desulfomonilia bacterium]
MQCPVCSNHLVTLEFADVEVDYCFTCRGIWLDTGEIEHLIRIEGGDDDLLKHTSRPDPNETRRRCPVCRRYMEKTLFGEAETVLLDSCKDHGMWFDAGELRKILALSCTERYSSPLIRRLDDMFTAQKGGCT